MEGENKYYANQNMKFVGGMTGQQLEQLYKSLNQIRNQKIVATQIFSKNDEKGMNTGKYDAFIYYIIFKEKMSSDKSKN